MKVVLEEIENAIARLIPDKGQSPMYVLESELPKEVEVGDVLELTYQRIDGKLIKKIQRLENEKERRIKKMKEKREALLNRTKK
ncbi:DUF3006 family protein [Carnobacterium divergens]|uniref:DUF3006 domain-containing protein n=1 Tax=Carnobacterium divergens TaxID=2748 RepID=A0A2R7ZZB7_CARDV|nr:DUF3006 family protein [Carnobacterium divergens]MCO6018070.1 DUF3006 family protein [Carnobacterium divergens]TFI61893.1 DUF3006 domain-containing protein [Carnobacterium divergens]TFI72396.1 DUF3006 domain-containing protein [Carnobacterium divergens]TFI76943.1 DUF3006 domain-containing protein [Carnobacterium divergens]TFI83126.1 DUF3006 domain-containing protein [Carnobacterium divergens]